MADLNLKLYAVYSKLMLRAVYATSGQDACMKALRDYIAEQGDAFDIDDLGSMIIASTAGEEKWDYVSTCLALFAIDPALLGYELIIL